MKGSIGNLVFRSPSSDGSVVSEKPISVKNPRTSAQQRQRMKWGNLVQNYKYLGDTIQMAFESKTGRASDYNMFVKYNSHRQPVYLTRQEIENGGCVAGEYMITQGSLTSIVVTGTGVNSVTDISLGSLIISDKTTVAEFATAVVQNNKDYNNHDQISYHRVWQHVNVQTQIPYCTADATKVTLDNKNNALLWSVVDKAGFQTVNGKLGHLPSDSADGAFCWVHTRKSKDGGLLLSSQSLISINSLLSAYTSQDAYETAVATYGGESNVFMMPGSNASAKNITVTTPSAGGGGSSSGGESDISGDL